MKKTILTIILAAVACIKASAFHPFENMTYYLRFGYSIGGTAPIGMPATIRSMESYKLTTNVTVGLGLHRGITEHWGLSSGLFLENKGMDVDATVKNYRIAFVRGGQRLEGNFTGHVAIDVEQWMLTLPLMVTYSINDKWNVEAGPYFSYVKSPKFTGYAYDGYIRVGDPTGAKVEIGSDEGNRGSYDFSDNMRSWQFGMILGANWQFYRQWGAFANLTWGLSEIFHSSFDTIEQDLYPIYGTIGITYKI